LLDNNLPERYESLTKDELNSYNDWLIILIEANYYCVKNNVEFINYSKLRHLSDDILNIVSNGDRPVFGGFNWFILKLSDTSCPELSRPFILDKHGPKDTRIIPNQNLIEEIVRIKKLHSSDSNKITFRIYNNKFSKKALSKTDSMYDKVEIIKRKTKWRPIFKEPKIQVWDKVSAVVGRGPRPAILLQDILHVLFKVRNAASNIKKVGY
jgi:hypothetical protein